MQTLGDPRAHFWRVIKMSNACGVDLSTALDENKIDITRYADMIERCRGCEAVANCDRQMAKHERLAQAPAYCENRAVFASLRTVEIPS